jgi:hypothetical protein
MLCDVSFILQPQSKEAREGEGMRRRGGVVCTGG